MDLSRVYRVYLDGHLLAQTPAALTMKNRNNNETFTLADGRPFTVARLDGPLSFEFEFALTREAYSVTFPYADRSLPSWKERLSEIKRSRRSVEFLVTRPGAESDFFEVLVDDYSFLEDAEDASDAVVTLSLTEYCPQLNQELDEGVTHHLITAGEARGWISAVDKDAAAEVSEMEAEEAEKQAEREERLEAKEQGAEERAAGEAG